jgi:hypothetical protein
MNPSSAEREASTLHTVCELATKHGPLTIVELTARMTISSSAIRNAVDRAMELGYLLEGEKQKFGPHKASWRKTYYRTRKRIPGVIEMPEREREAVRESGIFRHPHDVWFFGDAPAVRASDIEGRIFRQPMNFDDGRDV